jgi:serine/threonine-protein kinase
VPQAEGIPFGNYRLLRRIARGGMAEVFLARQTDGDRLVAIKRILPHLVTVKDFVRMFLDEAQLAARLSHPNIARIHEFGQVDEHYFIAMEYVRGVHAGTLIDAGERDRVPLALIARIGADAAAGLQHAHDLADVDGRPLGLVHRDVSPPNLLVSFAGEVKLVDFGIAKAVTCVEQTRPGVVKGKFAYMSPEQCIGRALDARSDVFSLALVLWELVAGQPAISRDDAFDGMRKIRDGQIPPLEAVRFDVPAGLAAAIRRALAVDRDQRPTAAELGATLEAFGAEAGDATAAALGAWISERHLEAPEAAEIDVPETAPAGHARAEPLPDMAGDLEETVRVRRELLEPPGDEDTHDHVTDVLHLDGRGGGGKPNGRAAMPGMARATTPPPLARTALAPTPPPVPAPAPAVAIAAPVPPVAPAPPVSASRPVAPRPAITLAAPATAVGSPTAELPAVRRGATIGAPRPWTRAASIAVVVATAAAAAALSAHLLGARPASRAARSGAAGPARSPRATRPAAARSRPVITDLRLPAIAPAEPARLDVQPLPGADGGAPAARDGAHPIIEPLASIPPERGAVLEVRSIPSGARVEIGDRSDRTPARFDALPAGTHTLRLALPGRAPRSHTIDLAPGEHRSVELRLSRAPPRRGGRPRRRH